MENRLKRSLQGLSALFMALSAISPAMAGPRTDLRASARNWIVVYKSEAAQRHAGQRRSYAVGRTFRIIPGETASLTDAQVLALRRNPDIAFVEQDRTVRALEGTAPVAMGDNVSASLSTAQVVPFGVTMVGAPNAWATTRGTGAVVAVLDTGYDLKQADHVNIALTASFIDGETVQDGNGHGTHTAGTIAAPDNGIGVVGVAPEASLLIGKVLGNDGSGTTISLVSGIDWAVRNGAKVINMSLGASESSLAEKAACDRAAAAGVIIVAAAGNDNSASPSYPAAYPSVVSVAAIDEQDNRAWFSNFGTTVSVAAPGVNVLSTLPTGTGKAVEAEWNGQPRTSAEFEGSAFGTVTGRIVDCGIGNPGDFPASVRGNIAHIRRGTLTFGDKVANAKAAGATGVILSNNAPGLISGTLSLITDLVVVSVSQADGDDLHAGGDVPGTIRQVATDYALLNGTSMASPHVAGVAALLVSAASPARLTPSQIRTAMETTAQDLGTAGRDDYFGNGLVNADRALRSLGLAGPPDLERLLRIAGGLEAATPADVAAVNPQGTAGIGLGDAVRQGRRSAPPNPRVN